MEKLIAVDVDGVLLDWELHFHRWMKDQGHKRAMGIKSYWQEEHYPGMSLDEARKLVYYFNTSAWMLAIPAFPTAREGVARLVKAGYSFVAITSMGEDPYALEARKINIERIFGHGVFIDVIATNMYDPDSKRAPLKRWQNLGIPWIEDRASNAELGAELGYRSFLISHPHNADHVPKGKIEVVSSWVQICDSILDTD